MPWTIYLPILISTTGLIVLPIITLIVHRNGEKKKLEHQYIVSINNLKERWMSYLRDVSKGFTLSCNQYAIVTKMDPKFQEYKTTYPRLWENLIKEQMKMQIKLKAEIEAKEQGIELLFKKDSKNYSELKIYMDKMVEYAHKGDRIKLLKSGKKFTEAVQHILINKWKIIVQQLQIGTIAS